MENSALVAFNLKMGRNALMQLFQSCGKVVVGRNLGTQQQDVRAIPGTRRMANLGRIYGMTIPYSVRCDAQLSDMLHQPRHPACDCCAPLPSSSRKRSYTLASAPQRSSLGVHTTAISSRRQYKSQPPTATPTSSSSSETSKPAVFTDADTESGLLPERVGLLVTTWRRRAASFARESTLLLYSGLIDNTLVVLLERLKVDRLLRQLQPQLERFSATYFGKTHLSPVNVTFHRRSRRRPGKLSTTELRWERAGSFHQLEGGRRVPLSLVNNTSPDFAIPQQYCPSMLPFGASGSRAPYDARIAHFMALCMKAVYEHQDIVQDLAERHWGMRFHGYYKTHAEAETLYDVENRKTANFIPRTRACVYSCGAVVVIAFRGSEPLNLINLRSSGKITMRSRLGIGRIHDGFFAALMHSDPEQANSLYSQLVAELQQIDADGERPLFLTGHSLGGALALVFAAALLRYHPELAARVSSVYTFGLPRVGDADFCSGMEQAFEGRFHRITHAADIIPLVPPRFLEYAHFGEERYLTSLGRLKCGSEAVRRARRAETFFFLPFYAWKLAAGLLDPKEGSLRTIYRLAMLLTFPGLSDHFPADYVRKLERQLDT